MNRIQGVLEHGRYARILALMAVTCSSVVGLGNADTAVVRASTKETTTRGEPGADAFATSDSRTDEVAAIPSGTVLPIRLGSLSSAKNKAGDPIKARLMQDVPLENGRKLRAGSSVLGRIVSVNRAHAGQNATLAIGFDTIRHNKTVIRVTTHLRAFASTSEVEYAQIPTTGAGESDVYNWLPTTQIGGEVVYGKGGEVARGERIVGRSVNDGVLARVNADEGTECRAVDGNDQPQALWVFSSDACGLYGFPHLKIANTGRTA